MTSSLVGSEMCIRDSPGGFEGHFQTNAKPTRIRTRPAAACCFCDSMDAVSYTHLTLPTICSV
eukprot:6451451-Prorocentrum_lima.AAC.1